MLRDLDSKNGTYLNGAEEPTYHDELIDSDWVVFGTAECKFKCI